MEKVFIQSAIHHKIYSFSTEILNTKISVLQWNRESLVHIDIYNIIIVLISILLSIIFVPLCKRMLEDAGHLRENYKGEKIPTSMGIVFVLNILLISFIFMFMACHLIDIFSINVRFDAMVFYPFMFIPIIGFFGLLDDVLGKNDKKGFKEHFKALFRGKLTSGALKAIGGFLVSILYVRYTGYFMDDVYGKHIEFLVNIFIIALSINFLNLLDLRPGRALKIYFLITAIVLSFTSKWIGTLEISSIIFGTALIYSFYDFRGKAMMGDVGSNILGFVIGALLAVNFSLIPKIFILLFLILIHIYCEFYSISDIIDRNRILKFLDKLGTN